MPSVVPEAIADEQEVRSKKAILRIVCLAQFMVVLVSHVGFYLALVSMHEVNENDNLVGHEYC